MSSEYESLCRALLEIAHYSEREWRRRGETPLSGSWQIYTRELLKKRLMEDDNNIQIPPPNMEYWSLVLPPTNKSVRGILAVNWAFGLEGDQASSDGHDGTVAGGGATGGTFRVFLMPRDSDENTCPTVIRFDESEDNESWSFAHAQLCDTLTPYGGRFPERDSKDWISATLPRIPLAGTQGAAPILVCVLAGLYGVGDPLLGRVVRVLHDKGSRDVAKRLGWDG